MRGVDVAIDAALAWKARMHGSQTMANGPGAEKKLWPGLSGVSPIVLLQNNEAVAG